MPLKKFRRGTVWHLRGTVRGLRLRETCGTQNEAAAEAIRIKRESELLNRSVFGAASARTLGEAALSYLEARGLKARDEAFVLRLVEHFGAEAPLAAITSAAIEAAIGALLPKAGPAHINRAILTPLAAVLHHAAELGWTPWRRLKRRKAPRPKTAWLKPQEAEALIAAAAPHLKPLIVFLMMTGARLGEALALDWENVDMARRSAAFLDTKNGDARGVPLNERAFEALANLPFPKGTSARTGRVFRRPDGVPYAARADGGGEIKTAFAGACRRAGLVSAETPGGRARPRFTPHDLRHTWATWLYAECRDLRVLMELGGWKSVAMVARYTHVNPAHLAPVLRLLPGANLTQKATG